MPALSVGKFFERLKDSLQLDLLGSPAGLERMVTVPDASASRTTNDDASCGRTSRIRFPA
jgi:hypothetical protein